jgi:hypothetical protein
MIDADREDYLRPPMEWEEAVELCTEIISALEDLPEAAEEFAESVEEKVISIREWIESNQHVTENQLIALQNMKDGVQKWFR